MRTHDNGPRPTCPRRLRPLLAIALGAAVLAAIPSVTAPTPARAWTPMTPVTQDHGLRLDQSRTARGRLLGINDFHGALEPPTGSGGLVNGNPAGGVEYLSTYVKRLRAEGVRAGRDVITVGAGDLVGATPLISAAFHDEPAIETLDSLGLDLASVGNHEYDEGTEELRRLIDGGCHPVDGCQDGDGFDGARFEYLAANVVSRKTGLPSLAPFSIRWVKGVPVGFVGMTLKGTPDIVNPAGITTVRFTDEVETANRYANLLRLVGVRSLVLMIHEGGVQSPPPTPDPTGCANFAGPITDIVRGLRPEYGVVVSGHTHRFYSCALPNSSGANTVVTSAGSNGTLVTSIDIELDRLTGRFARIEARNVITENGVRGPDGGWLRDDQGGYPRDPALVDADTRRIVDKYRAAIAPIANRVVGRVTADITRTPTPAGETPLGDVIADAQLARTRVPAGARIALMNPGGIRADLVHGLSPGGEAPGEITYGEAFTVQPFNNLVVTQTYTGEQLRNVLEQQFTGFQGQTTDKILQVSEGFTYSYDRTAAPGSRVSAMTLDGTPVDMAATYRVTANDFLANGGDGFTTLRVGTDRVTAPGFDVDALTAYLGAGAPVAPGPVNRVTRLG